VFSFFQILNLFDEGEERREKNDLEHQQSRNFLGENLTPGDGLMKANARIL